MLEIDRETRKHLSVVAEMKGEESDQGVEKDEREDEVEIGIMKEIKEFPENDLDQEIKGEVVQENEDEVDQENVEVGPEIVQEIVPKEKSLQSVIAKKQLKIKKGTDQVDQQAEVEIKRNLKIKMRLTFRGPTTGHAQAVEARILVILDINLMIWK